MAAATVANNPEERMFISVEIVLIDMQQEKRVFKWNRWFNGLYRLVTMKLACSARSSSGWRVRRWFWSFMPIARYFLLGGEEPVDRRQVGILVGVSLTKEDSVLRFKELFFFLRLSGMDDSLRRTGRRKEKPNRLKPLNRATEDAVQMERRNQRRLYLPCSHRCYASLNASFSSKTMK